MFLEKIVNAMVMRGPASRRIGQGLMLAGLVIALGGCRFGRQPDPAPVPLPTPTISVGTVYTVQRGPVAHTLRFNGKAVLAVEEELFFNKNGRVQAVYVESGQTVAAGEVIAQLETRDLQFAVDDAQLALELARQRLAEAEEQLAYDRQVAEIALAIASRRLQSLAAQDQADPTEWFIQQLQVEQAVLAVEQLNTGVEPLLATAVERAELVLAQAQAELADARITAPFAGQVRLFEELVAGQGVEAYTPVASVVDPDSIQLEANLLDTDLEQLHEGMSVAIQLGNRTSAPLVGTIAQLPQPYGSGVDAATRIALDNPQAALRAGMTATIVAEVARMDDALWVPPMALRGVPNRYYVVVREGDTVREVDVTVGVRNEERVQITQGVEEGQVVVGS